jgi:hypothetical protein
LELATQLLCMCRFDAIEEGGIFASYMYFDRISDTGSRCQNKD